MQSTPAKPRAAYARARQPEDGNRPIPIYVVWEVTLRCDQPCEHCGSRAGNARDSELSTQECLAVVSQLADMGCREVVLVGGEAYLRPDIETIIGALREHKIRVVMQSGGRGLCKKGRLEALMATGLQQIGISIDGPQEIHDRLRGNQGSYDAALGAIKHAQALGLPVTANSQVNRLNYQRLDEIAQTLQKHGVLAWQLNLTVPMGKAADRPAWLLAPHAILEVVRSLGQIQLQAAKSPLPSGHIFDVALSNTLGYFGPYESILRSRPGNVEAVWGGCVAGQSALGIEADGTIKGCPSLPTGPYAGGNIRGRGLQAVWSDAPELTFNRIPKLDHLWGRCKGCYYAEHCRGGCSWVAHTTLGSRGNNPFCYHRAEELARQGLRERLVPQARAPNQPFDFGRFSVEEVPFDLPEAQDPVFAPPVDRMRLPVLQ